MLVRASSFPHQRAFVPWVVSLYRVWNTNTSPRAPSVVGQWAFVPLVVSFYWAWNTNAILRVPSLWVLRPLGASTLPQGFPFLRVPSSLLRWWVKPHLEAIVNLTPCLRFSPLGGKSLQVPLIWLSPFENNNAGLPKSLSKQTNHPNKDQHSEERDHTNSKKPTVKQAMQDLNKYFHSKEIYICFILNSLFIPNTFIQINTRLHLTRVV